MRIRFTLRTRQIKRQLEAQAILRPVIYQKESK